MVKLSYVQVSDQNPFETRLAEYSTNQFLKRSINGPKVVDAVCRELVSISQRLQYCIYSVLTNPIQKRRVPNARSIGRDPTIEIDLSGKRLGDEAFDIFMNCLLECLNFRDEKHPEGVFKVTGLRLRGNNLSAMSLTKLGQVVALSAGDLRELNLSDNLIVGAHDSEKTSWHLFLKSFGSCFVMKKLDLGNNPISTVAVEMLARAYMQQRVDYLENEAEDVVKSGRNTPTTHKNEITEEDLKHYSCTRGLGSIPYLILSEIPLTKAAAIMVASMVDAHRSEKELLQYVPPGNNTPTLDDDTRNICNGLIWLPNNQELGAKERKMLELASEVSKRESEYDSDSNSDSDQTLMPETDDEVALREQKAEYAEICKQVRIDTLATEGADCLYLWTTACDMGASGRCMLMLVDDPEYSVNCSSRNLNVPYLRDLMSSPNFNPRPPQLTAPRKKDWTHELSFEHWVGIAAEAVGAHGILDKNQQTLIMRYAADWDIVAYEKAVVLKTGVVHDWVWQFLDLVGCFTYSPSSGG